VDGSGAASLCSPGHGRLALAKHRLPQVSVGGSGLSVFCHE
jgi:hypothetical protein